MKLSMRKPRRNARFPKLMRVLHKITFNRKRNKVVHCLNIHRYLREVENRPDWFVDGSVIRNKRGDEMGVIESRRASGRAIAIVCGRVHNPI